MPHSRSLSEQSCLLANADSSHENDRSRRGSFSPYTFPSQYVVHVYPDPEVALAPSSPNLQTSESLSWIDLPNKGQLLILSLCRLSSQLSNLFLLPYVFHLVRSAVSSASGTQGLSTDNDDIVTYYTSIPTTALVSTYSGALVACFPLAQLLVSFLPLEIYCRKLSIIWSLTISAVANMAFAFSRSFWALLFWRMVSGLASGNGTVVRRMAGKVVDEEKRYQDKVVQVFSMIENVGVVVGLAMGGLLAEPVKNMPGLFGAKGVLNWSGNGEGVKWIVQYHFALPAVVNAMLLGIVGAVTATWLRETRPGYLTQRPYILLNNFSTLLSSSEDEKATLKPSLLSILTKRTIPPLISSFLLVLHTSAFTFILPLHLSTPSSPYSPLQSTSSHSLVPILFRFTGGLSLSPFTISLYLSLFGLIGLLFRGYVYPRWQKRLSTMGLFELSLAVFPFVYLVTPYLCLFSWGGSHQEDTEIATTGRNERAAAEIVKWIALGVVIGAQTLAMTTAVPSVEVLLAESAAPSEEEVEVEVRERVQEVRSMVTSLASVVGPVVEGVVYAKGVREGVVGAAWWFYLVVVAVVAAGWCVGVQGRGYEERQDEEKR